MIKIGQIQIGVLCSNLFFACLTEGVAARFPRGSLASLVVLVWLREE